MKQPTRASATRPSLDRFTLYELCAQAPERDARLLRAIHGGAPKTLGEDFCGTAALSRAWADLLPGANAVAVDHDPEPLARARPHKNVRVVHADVMDATDRADLIAVLNFSICELHTRRALIAYLAHARSRLKKGGVFICDIYGGSDAFLTGRIDQSKRGPRGERITYTWEQRTADPLTGRVVNAMHFRVAEPARRKGTSPGHTRDERGSGVGGRESRDLSRHRSATAGPAQLRDFPDAFVYDWRLWSIPELREAMLESGFTCTGVYPRFAGATDEEGNLYVEPVENAEEVGDSFSVYVVGRREKLRTTNPDRT